MSITSSKDSIEEFIKDSEEYLSESSEKMKSKIEEYLKEHPDLTTEEGKGIRGIMFDEEDND